MSSRARDSEGNEQDHWSQTIDLPNLLAIKVGVSLKKGAAKAVAQAETALKSLALEFDEWVEQEVQALEAARAAVHASGLNELTATALTVRALDLKGMGVTYGYPLLSRVGASLFKLLDEHRTDTIPLALVDAHVDTSRALIRGKIRSDDHELGVALVAELEQRVRKHPINAYRP